MKHPLPSGTKIKVLKAEHNELKPSDVVTLKKHLPEYSGYEVQKDNFEYGMFVGQDDFVIVH
jgi:hypothetical protein